MEYKDFYAFLRDCKKYDKKKKETDELYLNLKGAKFDLNIEELSTFSYEDLSNIRRIIEPFADQGVLLEIKNLILRKKQEECPEFSKKI